MKIGIIGSGNVGGTLGRRWARNGHDVMFSVREGRPAAPGGLPGGSVREVAEASDLLLLATPWGAAQDAIAAAGNLSGKVVMDATNPLSPGLAGLAVGPGTSAAEMIAGWAPGARVVKVFNTVGSNVMADSSFEHGPVVMFYCGDDAGAKGMVAGLVGELGFEGVDAGPLTQARSLEAFALFWISLAIKGGFGREIGFRFLRRGDGAGS